MIDFFLHLDKHIGELIRDYGQWTYLILSVVVFCETGLVIMPFLPGDSLLFAAGMFCNASKDVPLPLNFWILSGSLLFATFLGDNVNYHIGKAIGPRVFNKANSKVFRREYLEFTQDFFEKHGPAAVIIARFVPIARTFAPFVAGMGAMKYPRFLMYSILGALLWVGVCAGGGYLFGNIPIVRDNFSVAIIVIVLLSVLAGGLKFWKHQRDSKKAA